MTIVRRGIVVAVVGSGGVGKTSLAVNLSIALARLGYRTGLLDADFGCGKVDALLGLAAGAHVGHLLAGEKSIRDVLQIGPSGVQVLPGSGARRMHKALTAAQRDWLHLAIRRMRTTLDFLLLDTSAGMSDDVLETLHLADRVIFVTSLEPSVMADAYASGDLLSALDPGLDVGVVVNAALNADEAGLAFRQLDRAAAFVNRRLRYYGYILEDAAVREAVVTRRAVIDVRPQAPASRCYRILASQLAGLGPVREQAARRVPPVAVAEVLRCA